MKVDQKKEEKQAENEKQNFMWNVEHDYCVRESITLSEYQKDVVSYMAGFIARRVAEKITCYPFIKSLFQEMSLSLSNKETIWKIIKCL